MEEAEARRQKLQALKERAKRAREGGGDAGAEDAPKLKFRNYQPKTDELKDGVVAPVKIAVDKELAEMGAVRACPGSPSCSRKRTPNGALPVACGPFACSAGTCTVHGRGLTSWC
jgi:hypothetical protein